MAVSFALFWALSLSREGDVDGALEILNRLADEGALSLEGESLRFLLLRRKGLDEDALKVASACLEAATEPLARSTWALRKGLLCVELQRKKEALGALQEVLRLRASEDHEAQARRALLDVVDA